MDFHSRGLGFGRSSLGRDRARGAAATNDNSTSLPRRRADRVTGLLPWLIWVLDGLTIARAMVMAGYRLLGGANRAPMPAGGLALASSTLGENRTGREPGRSGRARPPRLADTSRAA